MKGTTLLLTGWAGLAATVWADGPGESAAPSGRSAAETPIVLEFVPTLRVYRGGGWEYAEPAAGGSGATDAGCPQLMKHTNSSFGGGSYILQAGFAQGEMLAVSFTVPAYYFPLRIKMVEVIVATAGTTGSTTTRWSILVYQGRPNTAQSGIFPLAASSNGEDLPHIVIPGGSPQGVNLQFSVEPGDPEQWDVPNNTAVPNTFSVAFRIDQHNNQTSNPCFVGPPTNSNAFPAVDTDGQQFPSNNWLYGINCGPFGCPPNGGWTTLGGLSSSCRPSGDWVIRVTIDPSECPPPNGACCLSNGTCVPDQPETTCNAFHGTWKGPGSTCAAGCATPCCIDYNDDGELDFSDVEGFLARYNIGAPGFCAPGADLNQDFEVDFTDIESFIAKYTAGC